MPVTAAVMGKHPGYGDFLRHGLSDAVADGLSRWVDQALFDLREDMGGGWQAFWDGAQDLRFWIGRAVMGCTIAGVLRPSRDRVGRRYPLMLLVEGAGLPPPVLDRSQDLYEGLAAHLDAMAPGQGAEALLEGLVQDWSGRGEGQAGQGPLIWAHHPEGDLEALLHSACPVDHLHAATARSYWWAPGGEGRAAVWLAQNGLPAAASLGWLLAGVETPVTETDAQVDR